MNKIQSCDKQVSHHANRPYRQRQKCKYYRNSYSSSTQVSKQATVWRDSSVNKIFRSKINQNFREKIFEKLKNRSLSAFDFPAEVKWSRLSADGVCKFFSKFFLFTLLKKISTLLRRREEKSSLIENIRMSKRWL